MTQGLGIRDTLQRLLLTPLGGRNLAVTRDNLAGSFTLQVLRQGVLSLRSRCTVVTWDGARLACLASARARGGPRAWEVDQLYLPRGDERSLARMLELLGQRAAQRGARRVFLRMLQEPHLEEHARVAGFFPSYEECLLEGQSRGRGEDVLPEARVGSVEARHQQGLFQLYGASTPTVIRQSTGMTLEEWQDSRENSPGKCEETVFEVVGRVRAWLALARYGGTTQPQAMLHPEVGFLSRVVSLALRKEGKYLWLVPQYQQALLKELIDRGFNEAGSYSVLVKTVTVSERDRCWTAVEVAN